MMNTKSLNIVMVVAALCLAAVVAAPILRSREYVRPVYSNTRGSARTYVARTPYLRNSLAVRDNFSKQNRITVKRGVEDLLPVLAEENVAVSDPVESKENVVVSEPVLAEENVVVSEPVSAEENVVVSEPVVSKENVVVSDPVLSEENVVVSEPVLSKDNVIVSDPVLSEENVVVSEPVVSKENVVVSEPVLAEENVVVSEPVSAEENVAVSDPVLSKENVAVSDPVVSKENVAVSVPVLSDSAGLQERMLVSPVSQRYGAPIVSQERVIPIQLARGIVQPQPWGPGLVQPQPWGLGRVQPLYYQSRLVPAIPVRQVPTYKNVLPLGQVRNYPRMYGNIVLGNEPMVYRGYNQLPLRG